jgi:translation elongation factor P/translation initiation factor 5A
VWNSYFIQSRLISGVLHIPSFKEKKKVIIYPDERGYTIIDKEKTPKDKLKELDVEDLKRWIEDEININGETND